MMRNFLDLMNVGVDGAWATPKLLICAATVIAVTLAIRPLATRLSAMHFLWGIVAAPLIHGFAGLVFYLVGVIIDQPHPIFLSWGGWPALAIYEGSRHAGIVAALIAVVVCCDAIRQRRDNLFFANARSIFPSMRLPSVRMAIIIGTVPLLLFFGDTVVGMTYAHERPCGLIWPPDRVYLSCLWWWGLLWLVDCWGRPRKGTIGAAIGFLIFVCLCAAAEPGALRE
jgi:hypothetical protein